VRRAGEDLLLGEARALEERARAHGVATEVELYPTDAHVFHLFWSFLPEAAAAIEPAGHFVRARTGSVEPLG
jgi:epsilon-lactone hydrolase